MEVPNNWKPAGVECSPFVRDADAFDMFAHTQVTVNGEAYARIFWNHDAVVGSDREFFVFLMGFDAGTPDEFSWAFDGSEDDIAEALFGWEAP